jgi:LuxR family transcriptional regulator, maltose regulon positive regulatory protein
VSAQAQAPLLTTKLHAHDPRGRIDQEALIARLCTATDAKLVWIRTPAGSGRSTLLSRWRGAEQGHRAFAWLTLDTSDSDPIRFWIYAVEALRAVVREAGEGSLLLLRAAGVDLVKMLSVLVEELGQIGHPWYSRSTIK